MYASRFNIFESQVSYAYARARSRGRDSHLIHMVERGNDVHRRVLSDIARLDKRMQKWVDSVVDSTGSSSPPSSLTETPDPYRSDSDDEDNDDDVFVKDPTTSGRIHAHEATTVVYRFAASLGYDDEDKSSSRPLFEFEQLRGQGSRNSHVCTVVLPPGAPIRTVSGSPYPTQSAARRAACLRTCEVLFYKGHLDYKLFPRPPPVSVRQQRESYVSPGMVEEASENEDDEEEGLSISLSKGKNPGTRCYPRRKPDFWTNTATLHDGYLYPTIISTDRQEDPPQTYNPILILTRLPLPPIASFKLFFGGVPSNVHFQPGARFQVGEEQLQMLHKYTVRLCRVLTNKPFICKPEDMAYYIAPLSSTWTPDANKHSEKWGLEDVEDHIPWDLVSFAAENWVVPLKRESLVSLSEDIHDAVIQDRWVEFTRRYNAITIRSDLNPLSKPEDSPVCADLLVLPLI